MMKRPALLARLAKSVAGVAMTEMAMAMPFLIGVGLGGLELANYTLVSMRVNQMAIHLADNASRVGDTSTLENRKIYEADINDLLLGSNIQGGNELDFYKHGRVIISSLQVDDTDQQFIKWQRCKGVKTYNSSYGDTGDTVTGMGPSGEQVIAIDGDAVIFVEVAYDYQPVFGELFISGDTIKSIASFNVRDKRDLTQIYQRNNGSPDPVATCNLFSGYT